MSEYTAVKSSKLRLKGESNAPKKKKKKKAVGPVAGSSGSEVAEDTAKHGGWTAARTFEEIGKIVALEFSSHVYMKALDNGLFTLGAPHEPGEPPSPEEIFTAIRVNEKVALKSGYGKYIRWDKDSSELVGRSDAIGAPEQWETVFEDNKMALLGSHGCFMSVRAEDDSIIATVRRAGPNEIITFRSQPEGEKQDESIPTEERAKNDRQIEINYVKKFQKFQNKRMRLADGGEEDITKAREEGYLHEKLLDRRSTMKADRYCK